LRTLWVLSAVLLCIGFCIFLYSSVPQTVHEPYTVWTDKTTDYLLKNGVGTATSPFYSTYFDGIYNFTAGDTVSITASPTDGRTLLSAKVSRYFGVEVYKSQDNTTAISMDYTIPFSGRFEITVSRYKTSDFEFFSTETSANVRATARMTEKVQVQQYRDVTTYPYKSYETAGIVVMLAGIGCGVLSVTQHKVKNQSSDDHSVTQAS
jgi:hypothetical protein